MCRGTLKLREAGSLAQRHAVQPDQGWISLGHSLFNHSLMGTTLCCGGLPTDVPLSSLLCSLALPCGITSMLRPVIWLWLSDFCLFSLSLVHLSPPLHLFLTHHLVPSDLSSSMLLPDQVQPL